MKPSISPCALARAKWPLYFSLYFMAIATILGQRAWLGFQGDGMGYMGWTCAWFADHPWPPFLTQGDSGHPMAWVWLLGFAWRAWGKHYVIVNLTLWLFGAGGLLGMHMLAESLTARTTLRPAARAWAGPVAAACLLATPYYILNCAQFLTNVPTVAFLLLMLAGWARGRRGWVTLWALALTFNRINGCLYVLGLGLVDLTRWSLQTRRRTMRSLLTFMAPYTVSALTLTLYVGIKLLALNLPLSTFEKSVPSDFKLGQVFLGRLEIFWNNLVCAPHYAVSSLLVLVTAAVAVHAAAWGWRRARGRQPRHAPQEKTIRPGHPGVAEIYAAAVLGNVFSTVFLLGMSWNYPTPGWFLGCLAAVILAAVHAWASLTRGWSWLGVPLWMVWCGWSALHWHSPWLHKVIRDPAQARWQAMTPCLSFDDADKKILVGQAKEFINQDSPPGPATIIFTDYNSSAIKFRQDVYENDDYQILCLMWMSENDLVEEQLGLALSNSSSVYFLRTNWDFDHSTPAVHQLKAAYPQMQQAWESSPASPFRAEVYRLKPAAGDSTAAALACASKPRK